MDDEIDWTDYIILHAWIVCAVVSFSLDLFLKMKWEYKIQLNSPEYPKLIIIIIIIARINGVQCKKFSAIGFILGIEKITICAFRAGLRYTYSKYPHISFKIYSLLKYNGVCVDWLAIIIFMRRRKRKSLHWNPLRKLYRTHNATKR